MPVQEQPQAAGAAYAAAAYVFWGVAPVYFIWVKFATPPEVLAHRILWSLPLLAVLITLMRQWRGLQALARRDFAMLGLCSVLLSINWLTFIYAIHTERIIETALGYYINPLVSIVLGWLVLGERLRPLQWVAAMIAAAAVTYELVTLGRLPWLGLLLAGSFGFYGLLRKQLGITSSVGLGVETAMLAPFALIFLFYWEGFSGAAAHTFSEYALLGLGGAITITPLLWFAAAAVRLPLSILGFFQYIAPSISLLLAVMVYDEPIVASRWISFAFIWLALAVFTAENFTHARRTARQLALGDHFVSRKHGALQRSQ